MTKLQCVHPGCPASAPGIVIVEAHDGQPRCMTHALDPVRVRRREERNLAGGSNRRRCLDPAKTPRLRFQSQAEIRRYLAWSARTALTDPRADLKALAEARASAMGASETLKAESNERLIDALARIEHGGPAVLLLERLRAGIADGPRRPLPGRLPRVLDVEGA